MAQQTIAQMVAVVSANTTELENRLAKVEQELKSTASVANKAADDMNKSFQKAATGPKEYVVTLKDIERGVSNLADHEYRTGQKTTADYKNHLTQRMNAHETFTTQWKQAASNLVRIEAEQQSKITADLRAQMIIRRGIIESQMVASGASKSAIRDFKRDNALDTLTDPRANLNDQIKASQDLVQIERESTLEKIRLNKELEAQRAASLANSKRFEFEQGNISLQEYRNFLQLRIQAYESYTAEYKAASFQLISLDRQENAERLAAEKAFNAEALQIVKTRKEAELAIEKEVNALMTASSREAKASWNASMAEQTAMQEKQLAARTNAWRSFSGSLGSITAGITAVSAASALMVTDFERKTAIISNNTIMTDTQLQQMRKTVLEIGKGTGQELDQLASGFMRIMNFNASGAWNTGDVNKILTVANKEALQSGSQLDRVANALAISMHVFGVNASEAQKVMAVLDQSAAHGNASMEEWVEGTSKATASAAAMKISITDVNAALTALTQQGFSTSEADTQVRNLITHIASPTKEALKTISLLEPAANKMGISLKKDFSSAGLASRGLYGVLQDIAKVTGGTKEATDKLIGAMRGGEGAYLLQTTAAKGYHDQLVENQRLLKGQGEDPIELGFQRIMDTGAQQFQEFVRTVQVEFMPIGQKAMALFKEWIPYIKGVANTVLNVMDAFMKLPEPIKQVVLAIGGLVILEKMTGLLTALRIPAGLSAGAKVLGSNLLGLGTNVGTLGTAFRGLAVSEGIAGVATVSLGEKMVAFAATGGAILLVTAALAGLGYELYKITELYDSMAKAQDQAARSEAQYQQKVDTLRNSKDQVDRHLANRIDLGNKRDAAQTELEETQNKLSSGGFGMAGSLAEKQLKIRVSQLTTIVAGLNSQIQTNVQEEGKLTKNRASIIKQQVSGSYNPNDPFGSPFGPIVAGNNKLTRDKLDALAEAEKARKKAESDAERAAKHQENLYRTELMYLQQILALKNKTQSLDTNNEFSKVSFDLSGEGKLKNLDSSKRARLLSLARQADNAEHMAYIENAIARADDKILVAKQGLLKQKAIEFTGGLKQWQSISALGGTASNGLSNAQNDVLSSVGRTLNSEEMQRQKRILDELAFSQKILGDTVKQAAVEAAGGSEKWNLLNDKMKETSLYTQRVLMITKGLDDLVEKYKDLMNTTAEQPKTKTFLEKAKEEVERLGDKLGSLSTTTKEYADTFAKIMQAEQYAQLADVNSGRSWLETQNNNLNAETDLANSSLKESPYGAVNVGQKAVDAWTKSVTGNGELELFRKQFGTEAQAEIDKFTNKVREAAEATDTLRQKNILSETVIQQSEKNNQLVGEIPGIYTNAERAVISWQRANKQAIAQLRNDVGSLEAEPILNEYRDKIIAESNKSDKLEVYSKAGSALENAMRQANELRSTDPFQQWLNSYMELQKTVDATGKVSYQLGLPNGTDIGLMREVYNQIKQIQEVTERRALITDAVNSISTGLVDIVKNGITGDSSALQSETQNLYSSQDKLSQYKLEQEQWKNKHPNDANDPYVERIKRIQKEVDNTEAKIAKMGSSIGSAFGRIFKGVENLFTSTLNKMAQEYGTSQLTKYLTRQVGTLPGVTGIAGPISQTSSAISGLANLAGLIGGAVTSSSSSGYGIEGSALPGANTQFQFVAAEGGYAQAGSRVRVLDNHEPEMFIPDVNGWIVPKSHISGRNGNASGNSNNGPVVNQQITIKTQDANSFRSSRKTTMQTLRQAIMR